MRHIIYYILQLTKKQKNALKDNSFVKGVALVSNDLKSVMVTLIAKIRVMKIIVMKVIKTICNICHIHYFY